MLLAQLIILLLFIFAGLIFFLRYILGSHITRATGHLQELSKDYTAKQQEIDRLLNQAKEEARNTIAKSKEEAKALKSKLLQEAQENKDRILKEAHQRSEQTVEQAERTCEFLKREVNEGIEERALEKASQLLQHALPEKVLQELHSLWMRESSKSQLQLGRLNFPGNVKEAKIVSSFPLTRQETEGLREKLKRRLAGDIILKEEVDPGLVAGFIITIGSVVIDASLRYKIQQAAKNI